MVTAQKQKEWQKALKEAAQITDKLGMPIDKEILETVTILYLLGFMTTGSCGGHLDRINEGPFVILGSPKAIELEKRLANVTDYDNQEYSRLKNEIAKLIITEQSRLLYLLRIFYSLRKPREGRMLTLRSIGYSNFRLNCHGSELAYSENARQRKLRLARNRAEMGAFTEWLKELYFKSSAWHKFGLRDDIHAQKIFVGKPKKEYGEAISKLATEVEKSTGIHTTLVFDGCFDGFNCGPYIIFESPKAEEVRNFVVAAKDSLTHEERNSLYKRAIKYNTADQQKLYCLLDNFYAQRKINYEQMLIVQTVGFSNFRLRNQGTEIALLENLDNRRRKLKANYDEIRAFIKYLK